MLSSHAQRTLRFSIRFCAALLLMLCLSFAVARGQVGGSGALRGTVADASGAVVPGATVTVTNLATNATLTQQTTSAGFFALPVLPAGQYRVTITAPGFKTRTQDKVAVDALGEINLNVALDIGNTSEVIEVTDNPPQIETANATLGYVVRNEQYNALPLAMNAGPRDPTSFVALVPGVQALQNQAAGSQFASFNGGQGYLNETYIEGIPQTSPGTQGDTRGLGLGISVEAIDQFQVETNSSPAQFQGQGIENYTIRSGSNQFHGAIYEYFRNTVLDARGYFPTVRPIEKQNQFGGRVGGRILRDKIFFFTDFDGYYYRSQSTPTLQTVPTLLQRMGNFSELVAPGTNCATTQAAGCIYDPLTTNCTTAGVCTRQPFLNNSIPLARLSAVSQSLASYLPAPSNGSVQNNYLTTLPIGLHNFSSTTRIDYNRSNKSKFYGFYSQGKYVTEPFAGISANTSALPLPYAATRVVIEKPINAQVHYVYTFRDNLLNQFAYSYNRLAVPLASAAPNKYTQTAGLIGLPAGQASTVFPTVTFNGPNSQQQWAGTNSVFNAEAVNTYVLQDNLVYLKGKHSVTFGAQFSWLQDNFANPGDRSTAGFTFANTESAGFTTAGAISTVTGNSYASYLLGAVDTSTLTDSSVVTTGGRYKDVAGYVQDEYRLRSNLTLNVGLRYDLFGVFHEVANRQSFFNPTLPNPALGGYLGALQFSGDGTDSCHCATPVHTHYLDFGPRISAAYSPNPNTSVRAGFSIMYAHQNGVGGRAGGRQGLGQLGFQANPTFTGLGNGAPAYFWSTQTALPAQYAAVPNGRVPAYTQAPFIDPTLNTGYYGNIAGVGAVTYGDPQISGKAPAFNNYTFSVQQAFTNKFTTTLAYTGSQGHYLNTSIGRVPYANQADPKYLALGSLLLAKATDANIALANARFPELHKPYANFNQNATIGRAILPFPQYAGITDIWSAFGSSNFNAVELIANYRASNSLTGQFAYTFSKAIDNINGNARSAYLPKLERGLSAIDRRHLITSSAVYTLPFGKGHKYANTGVANKLAGGFEVSTLFIMSSGAPLAITSTACQYGGIAGAECVPNLNPSFAGSPSRNGGLPSGNGNAIAAHNVSYINPAAFQAVPAYTFGNAPRTAPYGLRTPFTWNQDLTVRRNFSLYEAFKLQFAVSAFNVYNAVNFGGVNVNFDSSTFGAVTSQANQPRKLQAEARITF